MVFPFLVVLTIIFLALVKNVNSKLNNTRKGVRARIHPDSGAAARAGARAQAGARTRSSAQDLRQPVRTDRQASGPLHINGPLQQVLP